MGEAELTVLPMDTGVLGATKVGETNPVEKEQSGIVALKTNQDVAGARVINGKAASRVPFPVGSIIIQQFLQELTHGRTVLRIGLVTLEKPDDIQLRRGAGKKSIQLLVGLPEPFAALLPGRVLHQLAARSIELEPRG